MVESYHWHLDVTFREDENRTLEKQAAFNRNIIMKLALNVLKIIDVGKKTLSLAIKRFAIGTNPEKHLKLLPCPCLGTPFMRLSWVTPWVGLKII